MTNMKERELDSSCANLGVGRDVQLGKHRLIAETTAGGVLQKPSSPGKHRLLQKDEV